MRATSIPLKNLCRRGQNVKVDLAASVKHLFGYMTEGIKRATNMDELD